MTNLSEIKMQNTLPTFFSESNAFCGSEKTLHSLFFHHLFAHSYDYRRIGREYRLDNSPVDVVLWESSVATGTPQIAIEFKGGAYGNRNALRDTIDNAGYCSDLAKLQPFADAGMECWFVCVDMRSLGVALNEQCRQAVARQAAQRGINFAYYCQGDASFLVGQRHELKKVHVQKFSVVKGSQTFSLSEKGAWLTSFTHLVQGHDASEDTYAALLYSALRTNEYGADQVSLETYFKCASIKGSRMQLRPDLAVFHPDVQGNFNLYRDGNRTRSNDAHKISNLLGVIEIKGSTATSKLSAKRFATQLTADLDKLALWKRVLTTACPSGRAGKAVYGLVALDHGVRLTGVLLKSVRQHAASLNVDLIHIGV